MKKYLTSALAAGLMICAGHAFAQEAATAESTAANLNYQAVPNFFKVPAGDYMGETQGVATNSKGDVFIFFRGNPTKLWEFDKTGKFVREIGKNFYGFLFAHSVRVDVHDNIWTVDEGSNLVTEFSPDGSKVVKVLGWRPKVTDGVVATPHGPNPADSNYTFCRPTDVGWDAQDNIFVSDGYCNNRVMKYDPDGKFLAKVGGNLAGKGNEQFNLPHGLQVDKQGNVYVADRGNSRYQVFDDNLKFKASFTNLGTAWTACVSTDGPKQYFFGSNSNPNQNGPGTWAKTGQIYKTELDGTVIGKWGHAGKLAPGFQVVHMMDCRDPNTVYEGEIESWRVQKFVLNK